MKSVVLNEVFFPEIVRLIISFLPVYDRYNIKKDFTDLLEVQLMECRDTDDSCVVKKYISYYDNIRINDNKVYLNNWIKEDCSFDDDLEDKLAVVKDSMHYELYIHARQRESRYEYPYREVEIIIENMNDSMDYAKEERVSKFLDLLPYTAYVDLEGEALRVVFFVDTPLYDDRNIAEDDIEDPDPLHCGKSHIMTLCDVLVWQVHSSLFRVRR